MIWFICIVARVVSTSGVAGVVSASGVAGVVSASGIVVTFIVEIIE